MTAESFGSLTPLFVVWSVITVTGIFRHVKEQFANPRGQLMPDFRRVHAAVGIAALLLVAVVIPAILMRPTGRGVLGLISITVSFWARGCGLNYVQPGGYLGCPCF